uniref:AXH domain-containing protein n=1 Tax=Syphacia muris TaxID=451379 RepID=A0A0N5B006_9BILA
MICAIIKISQVFTYSIFTVEVQSALPYQRPPHFASESIPLHSYHPSHFMKGTVIQLQSGQLKRVEDMNTDDFVRSAAMNTDLILCYSTVRDIKNAGKERQVSIEADIEHPYFVVDQGWASCNPEKTRNSYGLTCRQLQVISAVLTSSSATVAETGGDKVAAEKYDGQGKQQQDDDNKLWRSSIMQPPSSGNISQSSSDGISQVSVRERSEFSN